VVVDDIENTAVVDFPNQIFVGLSGNPIVAVLVAFEESAGDSGRIPLTKHDFAMTPNGSDIMVRFP